MKDFESLTFDHETCLTELHNFAELLENPVLSERKQILPFFRGTRHLTSLLSIYAPNIVVVDRIAYELDLFGDFTSDVVLGDSGRGVYSFIEFEDAKPQSIFRQAGGKSTPERPTAGESIRTNGSRS